MLHETPVQQRVFFICITWPLMHMVATAYDPRRARAAMVAHIAESQKVNKRTAQKWVARFEAWAAE
ncbi:MAG: hypothetical protein CVV12_04905 [Gammaproteobacteria bacterium HGW-Gammaproteobacteria-2]|nr:MAG: hypothetical protein CVV12_04905 [Gammaproteobacteria bacterium HGW-Gammaproteobacteria-2]